MRVYVETYGCQMNEYDSKVIADLLRASGHQLIERPDGAQAVVLNTCAVRERAERRVLGRLRHLRGIAGREAVLAVVGCVAQRLGDSLLRQLGGPGFVLGTDQYSRLPEILERAAEGRSAALTSLTHTATYRRSPGSERSSLTEFVSVMRGCNNFCSYCIVPYVRGRERSRSEREVLGEVNDLVRSGTREVTLIGQNVNSYRHGSTTFAGLLRSVSAVPQLRRVRFATSHPKDLCDELIECVSGIDTVCEHIHLPVQSGSDRILKAMNRGYTGADYAALVGRIRDRIPGVAVTTDIIVGFPGERDSDYRQTLDLMENLRFDSAFMFRYSVRAGTAAAKLDDDVPERDKISRLEGVIALQRRITEQINRGLVGQTFDVLVEGPSHGDGSVLYGRNRASKAIVFDGPQHLAGELVRVRIESASAWTLHGTMAGESSEAA